ncbi:DEAD/DEAH box helicase [Thioalkalivibrio sp. XN8]|uniref:DEAD/DEAH box helicase n=1 Tax=Thioalkalivibrio sp. XN8 TaxID=2712863 RepID=UPI0013ECD722|nr:DEAD/DEAH box helicase [Thioalkalivibrio sp. XN8]NGP52663.1 DEAD/DEAH box helicase [Thioalkalivibrio sp. XN8]
MSEGLLTQLRFAELDLPDSAMQGLADAGFDQCTPIQAETLPIALGGGDVAGQAQTGTGKTAAFLVAMFTHLERNLPRPTRGLTDPRALILAPTRELAIQIHKDAELLGAHTGLVLGLAYGGTDYEKQRAHIQAGVDVLIGTPGRLIDYFKQHIFGLHHVQVMILDEADRMFDLGFIKDIRYVMRRLPPPGERLNLVFSATLSHRVLELAYEHMNDPTLVRIEPEQVTAEKVRQRIYFPANNEKLALLIGLMRDMDATRTMVFVNTKREADRVRDYLEANGLPAEVISGDVPQKKRQKVLGRFQSGELAILVTTDVGSRGLHIPGVSHVVNYDLPQDREDYVHRIGRTARAGESGDAISFGCETYVQTLPEIEDYIGMKIPVEAIDRARLPEVVRPARSSRKERTEWGSRPPEGGGRGRGERQGRERKPRDGDRSRRSKPQEERPAAAAGPAPAPQPPAESQGTAPAEGQAAPKKRRRRRRKSRAGGQGDAGIPGGSGQAE